MARRRDRGLRVQRLRAFGREGERRQPAGLGEVLKRVYTASNLPEAQLLVDRLATHLVAARILNANASSLAGELPIDASLPQVWVDNDLHATRARAVIEEFLRASPHGPPRKCATCGEENPPAFEVCWNCGASLGE